MSRQNKMKNTAVLGCQWGDEGKGKIVDILASDFDLIVRCQGGANAGHTVVIEGEQYILHLIPSGILHQDKTCIIGNGVVVHPGTLFEEIDFLKSKGIDPDGRLFVSERAHMVMPYHVQIDRLKESGGGIGTTCRGIGPAYTDKFSRAGLRIIDLMRDRAEFEGKLKSAIEEKNRWLSQFYPGETVDYQAIAAEMAGYRDRLRQYVADTTPLLNKALASGKCALFEGAQGSLLDVDHGTYPYVTSSNSTIGGILSGSGIGPALIEEVLGIIKAYTTRVGKGPFPTEFDPELGDRVREKGAEYGATTGRPRRCGWFDGVLARYAAAINGLTGIAVTKLDVLDELAELKICVGYRLDGEELPSFPSHTGVLDQVEPVYESRPGWQSPTADLTRIDQLPVNARKYLDRLAEVVGAPVKMVSVGPDRRRVIIVD